MLFKIIGWLLAIWLLFWLLGIVLGLIPLVFFLLMTAVALLFVYSLLPKKFRIKAFEEWLGIQRQVTTTPIAVGGLPNGTVRGSNLESNIPTTNSPNNTSNNSSSDNVLVAGCAWSLLPHDFPKWKTVYHYFRQWRINGDWERIHKQLRQWIRATEDRHPSPSAAILDSQSVETATMIHPEVGYDVGKKTKGRKRPKYGTKNRTEACKVLRKRGFMKSNHTLTINPYESG